MISCYDHHKHTVPKPVIVYDKMGVDDPHDNAALSIDADGHIWVFVSGRNTSRPGIIFKSRKPYDINSFQKIREGEMTYPQPWWINGKGFIYLFTKYTKGRELYWSTSADGISWLPEKKLSGMGGHYQLSNERNGRVITAFNYHPNGNVDRRTNIYFLQTDDVGKQWKTIDGKIVETPLTNTSSESLVKNYEKEGKLVYLNDLNFDKDGNPVILAVISRHYQPGPKGDPREWMILHWQNKKWNEHKVCESTHNYDMGSLYIEENTWRIIAPTEAGPQKYGTGGEMAVWISKDEGNSWKRERLLTRKSERNHSYARRPLHAHSDFYAFWADGNADSLSISKLYFTNKKGNKVFVLPYEMKTDEEKPLRVK
jgi:hypothetical protein